MTTSISRRRLSALVGAAAVATGWGRPSRAATSLAQPSGKVILQVSGKIAVTNDADVAAFDVAMLQGMPQHSFTTTTPWYVGPQTF